MNQGGTPGNILLSLQHDTGRYSGEYTYSAQDGMFGMRGLYNFGWQAEEQVKDAGGAGRRVDEEEMMEGGLRGRFSAGGEVYFSARQRSFGSESAFFCLLVPSLYLSEKVAESLWQSLPVFASRLSLHPRPIPMHLLPVHPLPSPCCTIPSLAFYQPPTLPRYLPQSP